MFIRPKFIILGLFLFSLMACSGSHHYVPSNITTHPTTQPTTQPAIICPDTPSFLAALAVARSSANTHIVLSLGSEYVVSGEIVVQGDGTTIDGNNATIVSTASYTGVTDPLLGSFKGLGGYVLNCQSGNAIVIQPQLGQPVAYNASQRNGLWFNPPHTSEALNAALGGSFQILQEQSPTIDANYPEIPEGSIYANFSPYIIPARNITIKNLNVRYASPFCVGAVFVRYAQNVTIQHVTILNKPIDFGTGGGAGDMGCDGSQNITFDSCVGNCAISSNSSTGVTVTNCGVASVNAEEGTRNMTVKGCVLGSCRTNDPLCSDILFDGDQFTDTGDNTVMIWGGTRVTVQNCTSAGGAWLGQTDTRQCSFLNNTGPVYVDFAPLSAGNSIANNQLEKP